MPGSRTPTHRDRRAHQRVTGSRRFAELILAGDFTTALDVATEQVRNGANIVDAAMDEAMLDSEAAMTTFLNMVATEPEIARVPIMVDSSRWPVIQAGLRCVQEAGRQLDQPQGGRGGVPRQGLREAALPAPPWSPLLRRAGPGRHGGAQGRDLRARLPAAGRAGGVPSWDIIFDPNVFAVATGIEEHNAYAVAFIEATRRIKESCPGAA